MADLHTLCCRCFFKLLGPSALTMDPLRASSPNATTNGSSAAQPATSSGSASQLATASSSVAQPATPHRGFVTLKDLREWLRQLPEPDLNAAPVQRVRNALSGLELPSSRAARSRLQALLKEWDIRQYQNASREHLSLPDAQERLSSAVLAEGSRLQ